MRLYMILKQTFYTLNDDSTIIIHKQDKNRQSISMNKFVVCMFKIFNSVKFLFVWMLNKYIPYFHISISNI